MSEQKKENTINTGSQKLNPVSLLSMEQLSTDTTLVVATDFVATKGVLLAAVADVEATIKPKTKTLKLLIFIKPLYFLVVVPASDALPPF